MGGAVLNADGKKGVMGCGKNLIGNGYELGKMFDAKEIIVGFRGMPLLELGRV